MVDESGNTRREILIQWIDRVEKRISEIKDGTQYQKALIGLIVAKATKHLKTKDFEAFYDGIDAALDCAYKNFPEIEAILKKL